MAIDFVTVHDWPLAGKEPKYREGFEFIHSAVILFP